MMVIIVERVVLKMKPYSVKIMPIVSAFKKERFKHIFPK